jgi:hypothetical protein
MSRLRDMKVILALGAGLLAAACSTPSARYGLAPPSQTPEAFPNINVDPAVKPAESALSPAQRAAAQAALEQQAAGKKPQAPAPSQAQKPK